MKSDCEINIVYRLIEDYQDGKLDDATFCDEFYSSYDLDLDKSTLSDNEKTAFSKISHVAGRFSEFEEDHKLDPNAFTSAIDLRKTVMNVKSQLEKSEYRFRNWMNFQLIRNPAEYSVEDAYVAHLGMINSRETLFKEYKKKLKLPEYFGNNWDALSDCLRDLHWISESKIVIIHNDSPQLDPRDLSTYLDLLNKAVLDWKVDEQFFLEIVFPESFRRKLIE